MVGVKYIYIYIYGEGVVLRRTPQGRGGEQMLRDKVRYAW